MIDVSKPIGRMSDDELAEVLKLAELIKDADGEQNRRLDERDRSASVGIPGPMVCTIRTDAACPSCGRNDAVLSTKPMYDNDMLGKDGKPPIGTLAYCKCGARYNAGTGEHVGRAYTY